VARVGLVGISKQYREQRALLPTDLEIADGEFLTLLGPSGCGKTTMLRIIAGFVEPTTGSLRFDGEDVTRVAPNRRAIGMVFQDYALFPHLTIADNIGFGLRERGWARPAIRARVAELLDLIELPAIGGRLPAEISGGQQQRVAFARAIAHPPRVLLMDEPLGALDLKLREAMQFELRRLQRTLGITTVYVTHDQTEAMNLSDRIAVMEGGRIRQIGLPREIYERPASRFVAEFVGQINLLPAKGTSRYGEVLAIRPQHLAIANSAGIPAGHDTLNARVLAQVFTGNLVHIQVEAHDRLLTVETRPTDHAVAEGEAVTLHWHPDHCLVLGE
jgi:putative spermidine/putrescine transport system ATP-binding protein